MMRQKDDVLALLREQPFFRELEDDATRAIAHTSRALVIDDGDVLFREGDVGTAAYVVLEGEVEIVKQPAGQSETIRGRLGVGELFGELALFGSGHRNATIRACGKTHILELAYEPFVEVIRAWPSTAIALLRLQTTRFLALDALYLSLERKNPASDS